MQRLKSRCIINLETYPSPNSPTVTGDETYIRAAWALGGLFLSVGALTSVLKWTGFNFLPASPELLDFVRAFAFLVSCINILLWIWFPLEDLHVLREWVRTTRAVFSATTGGFLIVITATLLLVVLIVSSTINALAFGIAGTGIYIWNLFGFAIIRREVQRAVTDARRTYREKTTGRERTTLLSALDVIEKHWCSSDKHPTLANAQQIRHALLAVAFLFVGLLGLGRIVTDKMVLELVAYIIGILTIIVGEMWIARWRISRDRSLNVLFEDRREIKAGQPPGSSG